MRAWVTAGKDAGRFAEGYAVLRFTTRAGREGSPYSHSIHRYIPRVSLRHVFSHRTHPSRKDSNFYAWVTRSVPVSQDASRCGCNAMLRRAAPAVFSEGKRRSLEIYGEHYSVDFRVGWHGRDTRRQLGGDDYADVTALVLPRAHCIPAETPAPRLSALRKLASQWDRSRVWYVTAVIRVTPCAAAGSRKFYVDCVRGYCRKTTVVTPTTAISNFNGHNCARDVTAPSLSLSLSCRLSAIIRIYFQFQDIFSD